MAVLERHAHLGVVLESADSGSVTRARVDNDIGTPLRINRHALRGNDARERVVDRTCQLPAVHDDLVVKVEDRGFAGFFVLDESIAPLANDVPEQERSLRRVGAVLVPLLPHFPRALYFPCGRAGSERRFHALGVRLLRPPCPVLMNRGYVSVEFGAFFEFYDWIVHGPVSIGMLQCSNYKAEFASGG